MRLAREGIRQRADFVGAHRVLTAAAGMAGESEIAKAALQELRRAQPNISLAWIAEQMPIEREHSAVRAWTSSAGAVDLVGRGERQFVDEPDKARMLVGGRVGEREALDALSHPRRGRLCG
jgi:hypothetical protein